MRAKYNDIIFIAYNILSHCDETRLNEFKFSIVIFLDHLLQISISAL